MEEFILESERLENVTTLTKLLNPKSIAVIGASRNAGTIGNKLFHNLLQQEFGGVIYPVNPSANAIAAVKAYPTILDIPGQVDLAVIITPAATVAGILEKCGQKGVNSAVIISAGFGENGNEGIRMQSELVAIAKKYKMRIVGPNCMGIINTDPTLRMNATFSTVYPPEGDVAFATQSGALGLAILDFARNLNLGLSSFVSIGNRADVSSNDLMQYWEQDPATKVILLYMESFGNPRKFARIARSITPKKPIIAVKSGRTQAGSRAAASHTGALATTDVASSAVFRQTGMIRVDTLEELFDVANLIVHQPIPRGRRVCILTNGGGPGIMTADACADRDLEISELSENTHRELKTILKSSASLANPVDMTAEASADQYRQALKLLCDDDSIDIVIVIFIPPILTRAEEVAAAIRDVAPDYRHRHKTIVAAFMGTRGVRIGTKEKGYVPSFAYPESIATALYKVCNYGDWLKRPMGEIPVLHGIKKDKGIELINQTLKSSDKRPVWMETKSVFALLGTYGINTVKSLDAKTSEEAGKAAVQLGFPVVVKLLSPTITHKSDVGGVILDVRSETEVKQAFLSIQENLIKLGKEKEMAGVTIQQMIPSGVETIVGVTQDPSFGPLIMFGMGGVETELFKDVTVRIHPLTDIDTKEMVKSVKAYKLLEGFRGSKPADISSIQDLLLRVSAMVEDFPQILEMDLNPVKVLEDGKGSIVIDARILLK